MTKVNKTFWIDPMHSLRIFCAGDFRWEGWLTDHLLESDYERRLRYSHTRSHRLAEARKKGAHTRIQWEALKRAIGKNCVRCGGDELPLERDHIKPLHAGGCDCIGNLQPVCARCNCAKGGEDIDYRHAANPNWLRKYEEIMGLFSDG